MPSLHDVFRRLRWRDRGVPPLVEAPPSWPEADGRRRVAIENEDAVWQWAAARTLEAAGYAVASCGGPHSLAGQRCLLVSEGACPLVDGADVVVNGLGISDRSNWKVLAALRTRRRHLPVVAEVPEPQRAELNATIPGCTPLLFPARPVDLVAAVDRAVRDTCDV
jgi:hypothetical protein